jgi:hypothetical protein
LDTILKINRRLVTVRTRLNALEYGGQAPAANPFSAIDVGVPVPGPIRGGPFLLQSDYDTNRQDVDTAFANVNTAMINRGVGSIASIDTKVDKAIKHLGEIEGHVTGESYSDGGHVFCSMTKVEDWLVAQQVPSRGVFWDLFSVLVSMKPKQQTGKSRADETYSSQRTNSTTLENNLLASMTHTRPEILFAKKGGSELGRLEDGFAACPSYQIWITGGEAYKTVLSDLIYKYNDGVLGAVDQASPHQNLVMSLLTNIMAQWNEMCTFIDSFYIELTNVTGFSSDKAWKLVGRCCAALFGAMQPFWAPVAILPDLSPLESKAACLWAVLQSHRVAHAFKKVQYRGHPAVVKEMNLFMLTERVDPLEVTGILEKVKKAERVATEAAAKIVKLKDIITSMKRDFLNLKTNFASAKRTKT